MVARTRMLSGLAIALGGSLYALIFGGDTIVACLGPLGVTAVRCAAHTGQRPTEGVWVGMMVAAIALGIVIVVGRTCARWADAAACVVGAGLGAIGYLARRPLTLEGPDYDGTWLVVPLHVSGWALLIWTIAAAVAGLAALAIGRAVRDRRRATDRSSG